jgi:hypothetical protein
MEQSVSSESSPVSTRQGSRLITRLLTPAIRLWLNTQIERATALEISIGGSDRQILSGYLPQAHIAAQEVIYKGLYLSDINVTAHHIRTNGLRVMRGHAFQLLEPIPIDVHLSLSETDLQQSLSAPLLADAIHELLQQILKDCVTLSVNDGAGQTIDRENLSRPAPSQSLSSAHIQFQANRLILESQMLLGDRLSWVTLETGLNLHKPNMLTFATPQLMLDGRAIEGRSLEKLHHFSIDLGQTTNIQFLHIQDSVLTCNGQIQVQP